MPANGTPLPTPLPVSEKATISGLDQDVEKELANPGPVLGSLTSTPIGDLEAERRLLWKVDCHVVPPLFILFLLAFLDRVNIGNANIQGLSAELHLEKHQYNIALFIFFIPYVRAPSINGMLANIYSVSGILSSKSRAILYFVDFVLLLFFAPLCFYVALRP